MGRPGMRNTVRVLVALCLFSLLQPPSSLAQSTDSATLTILRGQVAVVHPDGSAVQPAESGTIVRVGDEIRTLSKAGALITFFVGTEIEMGEETVLVVDRIAKQGEQIEVSLRQVLGATLNRVQRFTDPGSSVRIDAGGAIALVKGTQFLLLGPTPDGISLIVCLDDCDGRTTFAGCPVQPYLGYYILVDKGRPVSRCVAFRPDRAGGYWNAAFEALTTAQQAVQGNTAGRSAGQVPGGQVQETARDATSSTGEGRSNTSGGPPPGNQQCGTQTNSGGVGVTETFHEMGQNSGLFRFDYQPFNLPDQFDVYYENTKVFSTNNPVSNGSSSTPFTTNISYGPGSSTKIRVVVTGQDQGTAWNYQVFCPSD